MEIDFDDYYGTYYWKPAININQADFMIQNIKQSAPRLKR